MSSGDVLAFTVPIDGEAYASTNKTTRSGFDLRKSPIYKAVRKGVKAAAEAEMARAGWMKADCDCFVTIARIMPRGKRFDAANIGKPEMDALTDAGVWTDDDRANPPMYWVRVDHGGAHRIVVVVQKLYSPRDHAPRKSDETPSEMRSKAGIAPRVRQRDAVSTWKPGDPVPNGYAVEDGRRLVSIADAIGRMK